MTTTENRLDTARDLARRWDAQQTAYIRHRAGRFATIARVVAAACADRPAPRVLDLAGGFGSLGLAVLAEVPGARVVVADKDPVLLAIGADLAQEQPAVEVADVDLDDAAWAADPVIAAEPFDAVVSSTALHWLRPDVLTRVYWQLADLVAPGGIVLNGDHLGYDAHAEPTLRRITAQDDDAVSRAAFGSGVDTWDQWWKAAEAVPHYAGAVERRRVRWGAELHTPPPKVTLGFHLEALRSAGFTETGTIWRYLDDHVLYGIR